MSYILTYCKIANETLTTTLNTPIPQVFYIVSWELDRIEKEKADMERMKNRN